MAGEDETNRHNVQSEEIEAEKNRLTELSIQLTDERERQKNQYTHDYNEIIAKYNDASMAEKEWYDQQIVWLKDAEQAYESKYKEDMSRIQDQLAYWQGESVKNDAKYKEAWKDVQLLNADLEAKRMEYEATLKREQIESNEKIQASINALTEWKNTADYILKMQDVSQSWSELRRKQEETQLKVEQQPEVLEQMRSETSRNKSQTFRNYWESIFNSINETVENGFRIFDHYVGGSQYGKIKKAAEALFTN